MAPISRYSLAILLVAGGLPTIPCAVGEDAGRSVDFAREVLPILSNKCFVCHGPDPHDDTDLRLDSFAAATEDRGGYQAINPDTPADSEVLARIVSEAEPMPPADAEKQLTDTERDLIRRWIEQGGQYAIHWAFVPPQKADTFDRTSQAIDAYVGQQIKAKSIDFAPEADRATLARRVALILTGLPLEPEALNEYLTDDRADAYERLVDRLLENPRFGEHQARYWLDAVRYGDTHGLHLDNRRGIYPYRDWVVRAFNQNLPFDQFIEWQLAGDLLDEPTLEQQVATGYVRLNPSTGEGGAISDEFQMKNNFDRVETFGTVFLGMSLTCARCHTHKYDPIEQTEYYKLLAFFNSTAEPALDGNSYTYGPVAKVPANQQAWQQWADLQRGATTTIAAAQIDQPRISAALQYAAERAGWSTAHWKISKPVANSDPIPAESELVAAIGLPGTLNGKLSKDHTPGKDQRVWISFDLSVPDRAETSDPPTEATFDFSFSGGGGSQLLIDRNPVVISASAGSNPLARTTVALGPGDHKIVLAIEGAESSTVQARVTHRWDVLAKSEDWGALERLDQLKLIADRNGPLRCAVSEQAGELVTAIEAAQNDFTTSLIARDLGKSRETRLLRRGEYDLPVGDPLQPDTLAVMSPFPDGEPRNRLGLARWLTSPQQPLVARVLVNRLWQQIFGQALVRTPEDFGLQGEQSTHPELLDWLAVEFQESGWNMKQMLREMVTSRTFRQSSTWRTDLDDPENRLYARASSYRLDAEVLRDIGLWASQLLNPVMGGEGVKPYQPDGMWKALAHPASNTKQYQRDSGDKLYRRSLYVYWKRTSPHPMMTLFDAPDRESSCVRRSRTNTPLQSLGMLNETQRIEMGRSLAARLIGSAADNETRIGLMFRLLAHRDPTASELSTCVDLVHKAADRYGQSPADAKALLEVGEASRDTSLDAIEHAAWSQLATVILASDVAILLH